jgi:uncharacterized protein (TIGR02996 family)
MFRITVDGPGGTNVLLRARESFAIGSAVAPAGVQLAELLPAHARVDTIGGGAIIRAFGPMMINGRAATDVHELAHGDRVVIGPYTLAIEHLHDHTEAELLAAIDGGDHAARLIYADWLEERGEPVRAEYIRLQEPLVGADLHDDAFGATLERLRATAAVLPAAWRQRLARPRIDRCDARPCRQDWGSLAPTAREDERYCDACQDTVRYCTTVAEARALTGRLVAVDPAVKRTAGDLAPWGQSPPVYPGAWNPPSPIRPASTPPSFEDDREPITAVVETLPACPHCGYRALPSPRCAACNGVRT